MSTLQTIKENCKQYKTSCIGCPFYEKAKCMFITCGPGNWNLRKISPKLRKIQLDKKSKINKCIRCGFTIAEGNNYCGECICEDDSI